VQAQFHLRGVGVTGDVGEALLRDAVDDKLVFPAELGKIIGDSPSDGDLGAVGEGRGERDQRRAQSEVVEGFGP
jgi:hypothetical protein